MLSNLHVKNLALVKEADIDFKNGLNIITGETGAGKSIIIGSVNIVLGQKVSPDIIRNGSEYALVEAVFEIEDDERKKKLDELGVPDALDGQIVISRKIMPTKNITKINGETFTQSFVKSITAYLIDIHGQHEHQSLLYRSNYLGIIDDFSKAELSHYKADLKTKYNEYNELKELIKTYDVDDDIRLREMSFLEFEINEIESANLVIGEDILKQNEYQKLLNSRKIIDGLNIASNNLGFNDNSGISQGLSKSIKELNNISKYDEQLQDILNMMYDFENLYGDISRTISDYIEEFEFSEEDFANLEARINIINTLKAKYGNTIEEIISYKEDCVKKYDEYSNLEAKISSVQASMTKLRAEIIEICEKISDIRKKAAASLENDIVAALVDLNFNDVRFSIEISRVDEFNSNGFDVVDFYISTNPGESLRPLEKTVSGGELSRIMLALKSVIATKDSIDSLIFDEIDTGISGRTAQKVAEKLTMIASTRQIICITHLPQIAAMADVHFLIEKNVIDGMTETSIKMLDEDSQIIELGRMLGGVDVTDAVLTNAREMKELANKTKNY